MNDDMNESEKNEVTVERLVRLLKEIDLEYGVYSEECEHGFSPASECTNGVCREAWINREWSAIFEEADRSTDDDADTARSECGSSSPQHACSPAEPQDSATPAERLHSPVGVVLDDISRLLREGLDDAKSEMMELVPETTLHGYFEGLRDGLEHAVEMIELKRAKHGPSERSERRANAQIQPPADDNT